MKTWILHLDRGDTLSVSTNHKTESEFANSLDSKKWLKADQALVRTSSIVVIAEQK